MKIAIFDLDNTILNGDSDYSWINFLMDSSEVDRELYEERNLYFKTQYENGELDFYEWAEFALSAVKGKNIEEIEDLLHSFLSDVIEPMINVYALRLIHKHIENNDFLILASATYSLIVEPIGRRLGFKNIVSSDVETINGKYTGRITGIPALGEGKLIKVCNLIKKNNLDLKNATFYSDSINDLPLLDAVKNPIAVNPDRKLREIAIERNWDIEDLP